MTLATLDGFQKPRLMKALWSPAQMIPGSSEHMSFSAAMPAIRLPTEPFSAMLRPTP